MNVTISHASPEDVAMATLVSLRASALTIYIAARVWYAASQTTRENPSDKVPPAPARRGAMKRAYEEVLDLLPENSPFREPLTTFMESDIAAVMKDPTRFDAPWN